MKALRNSYGKSIIEVATPDNFDKIVKLRKNSEIDKKYLENYEIMLNDYEVMIRDLDNQNKKLRKQLFA